MAKNPSKKKSKDASSGKKRKQIDLSPFAWTALKRKAELHKRLFKRHLEHILEEEAKKPD